MARKANEPISAPTVGAQVVDISPERIKAIRHWTNYDKRPFIAVKGFSPEVFEKTVSESMTESEVVQLYREIMGGEPKDFAAAKERLVSIIRDGR